MKKSVVLTSGSDLSHFPNWVVGTNNMWTYEFSGISDFMLIILGFTDIECRLFFNGVNEKNTRRVVCPKNWIIG